MAFFKKKIAVKLAAILILSVSCVSVSATFYFDRNNSEILSNQLQESILNVHHFAKTTLPKLLWNYDSKGIDRFNHAVLRNRIIVAVNVYSEQEFFAGYQKDFDFSGIIPDESKILKLVIPFAIPENSTHIKKVLFNIKTQNELPCSLELFYSEKPNIAIRSQTTAKMVFAFSIITFLIIAVVFMGVKFLVLKPVQELADISTAVSRTNDYSIWLKKTKRSDELGSLFNSFVNMLQQISDNDKERNRLYGSLKEREERFRYLFGKLQKAVTEEDFTARVTLKGGNDEFANALNTVFQTLETADQKQRGQDWLKSGQTELNNLIAGESDLVSLCGNVISFMAKYVGAQVGTFFLRDHDHDDYRLVAAYAFAVEEGILQRFKTGEGIIGQAAAEKKNILFSPVPSDYIKISSTMGSSTPTALLAIPISFEQETLGVIELGAVKEFSPLTVEFIDVAAKTVAVSIHSLLVSRSTASLSASNPS